jgi:hypothetical protein
MVRAVGHPRHHEVVTGGASLTYLDSHDVVHDLRITGCAA